MNQPSRRDRLQSLRDELLKGLVERDVPVRLALLAALAGEHVLLIGPPGTAKSEIARRLRYAFQDATFFERLLTRFSVPEELFGPLSIKGLEEDRYHRLTQGYLPSASVAFLDEIFKANSAILNSLLTLLNEREFDNGTKREITPLISVIGASNELPEGEEMAALYDRFLLRCYVPPVSNENFGQILALRGNAQPQPELELRLASQDLEQLRKDAQLVKVPSDVLALLTQLRTFLQEQKIPVSDRRWRKIVFLLQMSAYSNGRNEVSVWDCWLLQHCTWEKPDQREGVQGWYGNRVGVAGKGEPGQLTSLVNGFEKTLEEDRNKKTQSQNEKGNNLYKNSEGNPTTNPKGNIHKKDQNGEFLYKLPQAYGNRRNSEQGITERDIKSNTSYSNHIENTREYLRDPSNWITEIGNFPAIIEPHIHRKIYIDAYIKELESLEISISKHIHGIKEHLESGKKDIDAHLWIEPGFSTAGLKILQEELNKQLALLKRVRELKKGFAALPHKETL